MRLIFLLLTILISCFSSHWTPQVVATSVAVPAFPGAEGYGAQSLGGRGGQVIEVTNLNDSGAGSLRAAIEAEGPRTVVFRVGGTIELESSLEIKNPYITIAGQTAPGGGVAIRTAPTMDHSAIEVATEHVILRYLRVRPGPMAELSENVDALVIGRNARHVMIDHCSFSWSTDETISIWYNASDITIQWSIISEALWKSTHDAGPQSYGLLAGDRSTRISFHHNLLAHNHRRNPRMRGGNTDVVNNVIYNAGRTPTRLDGNTVDGASEPAHANYVGNYIKAGPSSDFEYEVKLLASENESPFTAYIRGNIGPNRPDENTLDRAVVAPEGYGLLVDTRSNAPLVTTTSATEAYDQVLANAGAVKPMRDAVDERVVEDVIQKTGQIIDDPSDVGGWPTLAMGTPPDDSDHDGMPDAWETAWGSDANDDSDGYADFDGDGYTNLEEYLNDTNPRDIVTPRCSSPHVPLSALTATIPQPCKIFLPYIEKGSS